MGADNIAYWSSNSPNWDDDDRLQMSRLRSLYQCLVDDDRVGIANLLHDWEGMTVGANRLELFWQRTPFPVELI